MTAGVAAPLPVRPVPARPSADGLQVLAACRAFGMLATQHGRREVGRDGVGDQQTLGETRSLTSRSTNDIGMSSASQIEPRSSDDASF